MPAAASAAATLDPAIEPGASPGFIDSETIPGWEDALPAAASCAWESVDFTVSFFPHPVENSIAAASTSTIHFKAFPNLMTLSSLEYMSASLGLYSSLITDGYLRGDHAGEPAPASPRTNVFPHRPSAEIILSSEYPLF
ncbi:MAG: hypothetical protein HW377_1265 [Actinobacteria bacterium]|nr:hypothetical protein [Actinomycetota bacterium]